MHTTISFLLVLLPGLLLSSIEVDYMSKRKSVEVAREIDAEERVSIVSDLCTTKGVAKVGLARTLKKLYDKGLLNDALVEATSIKGYQRQVQKAIELEAVDTKTPYGHLLQELDIPTGEKKPRVLYYIHPKALIYQMCQVNRELFLLCLLYTSDAADE